MAASCLLPLEILELILAALENNSDLSACALVSWTFLPVARSLLFRHVFLLPKPRHPAVRSCSLVPTPPAPLPSSRSESLPPCTTQSPREANVCLQLLSLLSTSPTLAHHIKRLSIIDGRLFPCNDILASQTDPLLSALGISNPLQYHATRDKLNGPPWFLNTTPPGTLHTLFSKLCQAGLRDFDLVFPDGPKVSWNVIPPDTQAALGFLFSSPQLERIEIRGASWDNPTHLRDLTDAISTGGAKSLVLRGVKLLDFGTQKIPNRGRPTTRIEPSCSPSHHAKVFFPGEPNFKTRPPIKFTAFPLISLSSHAYKRMLDLESLCLSPAPGSAGPQAPEILALLRVLFLDPEPLVNPLKLKKLDIPSVELHYLPELLDLLRQSGITHGLESLTLSNRLNICQDSLTNFSDFLNLRHLRLGIHIPHNPIHSLPSYPSFILHPPTSPTPPVQRPPNNTLLWLTHALSTLPPTLHHLVLNLTIDNRSFHRSSKGDITTDHGDEWRELAERVRLIRGKVKVDVRLDVDCDRGGSRVERGRGRGRGVGLGLGGNEVSMGMVDGEFVKKYLDGLFV